MRVKEYAAYFLILIFLFILLNLPVPVTKSLRSMSIVTTKLFAKNSIVDEKVDIACLKVENAALKEKLLLAREWLSSQDRIEEHTKKIQELLEKKNYSALYKRRVANLKQLLECAVDSVSAKVIFRDPSFWSSGFWVNKGEKENKRQGSKIIAKNSPVIIGNTLIGIIDEVEENRSYVRLITDSSLTPAVRACRGGEQNQYLLREISHLEELLQLREDIQEKENILNSLAHLKRGLEEDLETHYLVKGEIRGFSSPLWRMRSNVLKGIGFNYEYPDEEGPAREIHRKSDIPLLQVGDLLITSGLDGIFPKGLEVATVSKIFPLKEGSFAYDIEAVAAYEHINDVQFVEICPPLLQSE